MPGRNAREAFRKFQEPLERSIGAVDQVIRLSARLVDREEQIYTYGTRPEDPIDLAGKPLKLFFRLNLGVVRMDDGRFRMTTKRYDYTIYTPPTTKNRDPETHFGWHWHPASKQSNVTYPHVHVPAALRYPSRHIPTGRLALEDVLLFCVDELKCDPAVPNAREIILSSRHDHVTHRSWA